MDNLILDWSIETEEPDPKKSLRMDHELVELLWQNGQVVLSSQTHRKPGYGNDESRERRKLEEPAIPANLIQADENESESWLHCPIDDSLCPNILPEISSSNSIQPVGLFDGNNFFTSPNPRFNSVHPSSQQNLGQKGGTAPRPRLPIKAFNQGEVREHSIMTVGSSHCGSNQVATDVRTCPVALGKKSTLSESIEIVTLETAITTSSGGSGSSFAKTTCNQSTENNSYKRKNRDREDTECQSEAAEGNKSSQKAGTSRRSRAAEVHNLSERRRRDRINEKMRALQELIPHSNKSDKASMLDEAIEYMKSLQLQLQMLWMGSGMAQMIFPSHHVQQYMSRMGIGMGIVPSIHNVPMQLMNMQNPQLQNPKFHDQYVNYMAFQNASQPINMFNFGSHSPQQNHMPSPPFNPNASSTG